MDNAPHTPVPSPDEPEGEWQSWWYFCCSSDAGVILQIADSLEENLPSEIEDDSDYDDDGDSVKVEVWSGWILWLLSFS